VSFKFHASYLNWLIALKRKKLQGAEGFVIIVRHVNAENRIVWNLGSFELSSAPMFPE
jgi:hypothetical protein